MLSTLMDVNAKEKVALQQRLGKIESVDALMSSDIKSLPKPTLVKHIATLREHMAAFPPTLKLECTARLWVLKFEKALRDELSPSERTEQFDELIAGITIWGERSAFDEVKYLDGQKPDFWPVFRDVMNIETQTSCLEDMDDDDDVSLDKKKKSSNVPQEVVEFWQACD